MVALKHLESVLGKVATIGMAGYLFGWLCFIACVICTLAKAAQWRDVAGYCAFLLGGSSIRVQQRKSRYTEIIKRQFYLIYSSIPARVTRKSTIA